VTTASTETSALARKPRVLVLFGGRSSEHSVSCVTAAGVLEAIDRSRYDVVPVGITKSGQWSLVSADPSPW
jgi:D-alanine-D-alanine ligase